MRSCHYNFVEGSHMSSITVRAEHRQQQTLSPRLQQAVRLLQLSSLDFAQEVHDALGRNPFLEAEESEADAQAKPPAGDESAAATASRRARRRGCEHGRRSRQRARKLAGRRPLEHAPRRRGRPRADGPDGRRDLAGRAPARPAQRAAAVAARSGAREGCRRIARRRRLPAHRSVRAARHHGPQPRQRRSTSCRSRCSACSRSSRPAWPRATCASVCCCNCRRSTASASASWRERSSPITSMRSPRRTWSAWRAACRCSRPRSRRCASASAGSTRGRAGASAPPTCTT